MKILISESQYSKLFESQGYMNILLDKINSSGISSLTDEEHDALIKISQGHDIQPPGEDSKYREDFEGDVEVDSATLFFHYVPEYKQVTVGDQVYDVIRDDADGDMIRITGPNVELYVTVFYNGTNKIMIDNTKGVVKSFKVGLTPKNEEEIKRFIDRFYETYVPNIIEKVGSL